MVRKARAQSRTRHFLLFFCGWLLLKCSAIGKPYNSENKPRGLCFSKALFERLIFGGGLYSEGLRGGKFAFKIDWTSLIIERNLLFLLCFTLYFEGNFQEQAPGAGLYLEGRFNRGFFGVTSLGVFIWRGLYMEGLIFGILR